MARVAAANPGQSHEVKREKRKKTHTQCCTEVDWVKDGQMWVKDVTITNKYHCASYLKNVTHEPNVDKFVYKQNEIQIQMQCNE